MSGRVCGRRNDGGKEGEGGLKRKRGNRITGSADIWNVFRRVSESCRVWMLLRGIQLAVTWLRKWLFESMAAQGKDRERDTKRVASYRNACRDVSPKCVFTHYLLSVLLSKLLWFSPFRIRFRFNCALREKCFYERIIWLIKDMNKRSYKPSVCFFLRCSQLGSNGRIKGVFVWPPL